MPDFTIHLAIAKTYAKKHKVSDELAFLRGNIAPDLARRQGIEHPYKKSRMPAGKDIREAYTDRLDLEKYLFENKTDTDFEKGAFLHLYVDQHCFPRVLNFERFQQAVEGGADVRGCFFQSIKKHHEYIVKKYGVDFKATGQKSEIDNDLDAFIKEFAPLDGADDILDIEKLEKFIDEVTDVKIEERIAGIKRQSLDPFDCGCASAQDDKDDNCIFCKIVRGEIPSSKVYEDQHTLAFFDINPASEYHTLVISKKHYVNMFDIPEDEAASLMRAIKKVVSLYEKKLDLKDVNVINNSGAKAHQDVFHIHYHIVPRLSDDSLGSPWKRYPELREKFAEMLERLTKS